jgi:hypothetical protein
VRSDNGLVPSAPKLVAGHAEAVEHRDEEVGDRGLGRVRDVAPHLEHPTAAADQHRQVGVVVLLRVAHVARRDHEGCGRATSRPLGDGVEPGQQIGQHRDVPLDALAVADPVAVAMEVGEGVVAARDADVVVADGRVRTARSGSRSTRVRSHWKAVTVRAFMISALAL